jgi:hypothetical protein
MACTGKMPTCQAGAAPSLSQVVYYGGANPSEIFVGSDPAETLSSITVSFLSAQGTALSVDPSGDGTAGPVSSVTLDARSATGQSFYFQNNPAATFPAEVPKISVLATDSSGRSGAPVTASVTTQPMHGAGQPCDAYGIVACTVGNVCSPGLVGATNACGALPSLQTAKCSAAPLTTTGTVLAGWGTARGVSLWDPPAGCASGDSIGRPEGIVMLTLSHEANILTVSSATPETNFDTILYVVPACAASSAAALGCNDDSQGYSSTVTLTNVPAGTYTIVVDSAGAQGGQFGITISEQ